MTHSNPKHAEDASEDQDSSKQAKAADKYSEELKEMFDQMDDHCNTFKKLEG